MAASEFNHTPILKNDVAALFFLKPGMVIVDGTLGGGGHAEKILEGITPNGTLIGIDCDKEAINAASQRLEQYSECFIAVKDNYNNITEIVKKCGFEGVDGVLLDLGVSSHQLDTAERGFSYRYDAPLDMRMDTDFGITAKDVVNEYSQNELTTILFKYGEERFAKRIAAKIIEYRQKKIIETTFELVDIIKSAIPAPARRKGGHPAKRTFQSIRIVVNGEITDLKETIKSMINLLNNNGHLCVISFHSLEDRIIKHTMREMENPCICPSDAPICACGRKPKGRVITRKPIRADEQELKINPRASSAKLRCFVKIDK